MANKQVPSALKQHLKGERKGFSISGFGTHADWLIVVCLLFVLALGAVFHAWRVFSFVSTREFTVTLEPEPSEFDPEKFEELLKILEQKSGN